MRGGPRRRCGPQRRISGRSPTARRGHCASARSRASACACCRARCGATSSAGRTSRCAWSRPATTRSCTRCSSEASSTSPSRSRTTIPAFERVRVISDPYVLLAPAELGARAERAADPAPGDRRAAADRLPQRRRGSRAVPPLARARARDRLSLRRGRDRPGPRRRRDRLHGRAAARRGREPRRRRARGGRDSAAPDHDRLAHRPHAHPRGPGVRRDRHRARGRDRGGLRSGRDEPSHATHGDDAR